MEKQRHMELVMRFLAHTLVPYDGKLDVEEYIDESSVLLAKRGDAANDVSLINTTFGLLNGIAGNNALRRYERGQHSGRVGLVGLEGIAVGVAKNLPAIQALGDQPAKDFVKQKMITFWEQPGVTSFMSPGLRGTVRIQKTVPFGEAWFRP